MEKVWVWHFGTIVLISLGYGWHSYLNVLHWRLWQGPWWACNHVTNFLAYNRTICHQSICVSISCHLCFMKSFKLCWWQINTKLNDLPHDGYYSISITAVGVIISQLYRWCSNKCWRLALLWLLWLLLHHVLSRSLTFRGVDRKGKFVLWLNWKAPVNKEKSKWPHMLIYRSPVSWSIHHTAGLLGLIILQWGLMEHLKNNPKP